MTLRKKWSSDCRVGFHCHVPSPELWDNKKDNLVVEILGKFDFYNNFSIYCVNTKFNTLPQNVYFVK